MRLAQLSVALLFAASSCALAQQRPIPNDPDLPSVLSDVRSSPGIGARLRGLNGAVSLMAIHDSSAGWYQLLTPALAYSFTPRFSADISMPVYLGRLSAETTTTRPYGSAAPPNTANTETLTSRTGDPGDLVMAGHLNFAKAKLSDTFTPSLTFPTGDSDSGLSTGRVTFDFDNHSQFALSRGAILLDLGGGDSSNLINRLVTYDYTSLRPLAHFQVGFMATLPHRSSFQSVAYEQLPLGDSRIYTTLRRPSFPAETVVSGRNISEDNGFLSSLALPLQKHLTLDAYYNRSLRLHLDVVAVGVTWVARSHAASRDTQTRLIDELIR